MADRESSGSPDGNLEDDLDSLFQDDGTADSLFGGPDDYDDELFHSPEEPLAEAAQPPSPPKPNPSKTPSLTLFLPRVTSIHSPAVSDNSGSTVEDVSTQSPAENQTLSPADSELQELEELLEQDLQNEQFIDTSHIGTALVDGDQAGHSVDDAASDMIITGASGAGYGRPTSRLGDNDPQLIERLVERLKLSTKPNLDEVYDKLGLDRAERQMLWAVAKGYLRKSSFPLHLSKQDDRDRGKKTKLYLVNCALDLLEGQNWGPRLFSPCPDVDGQRVHSWPTDSIIIIEHVMSVLYKGLRNEQQRRHQAVKKENARFERALSSRSTSYEPSASPLSESSFDWPVKEAVKPDTPRLNAFFQQAMNYGAHSSIPPYMSPFMLRQPCSPTHAAHQTTSRQQRASSGLRPQPGEAILISDDEADEAESPSCQNVDGPGAEMPSNLTFNIDFLLNGARLQPRVTLQSAEEILYRGYTTIVECTKLSDVGKVTILTPSGLRSVRSDDDWISCVHEVAEDELMDGVVKVRIEMAKAG